MEHNSKQLAIYDRKKVVVIYETTDTYTAYETGDGETVTRVPHYHKKIMPCMIVRIIAPGMAEFITGGTIGDPERLRAALSEAALRLTLAAAERDTHCGEELLLTSKAGVGTLHYAYAEQPDASVQKFVLVAPVDLEHEFSSETAMAQEFTENKTAQFLVPHLIGNPVDAADSFVSMARRQLEQGNYVAALDLLKSADGPIEQAKKAIHDFRTGKYEHKK